MTTRLNKDMRIGAARWLTQKLMADQMLQDQLRTNELCELFRVHWNGGEERCARIDELAARDPKLLPMRESSGPPYFLTSQFARPWSARGNDAPMPADLREKLNQHDREAAGLREQDRTWFKSIYAALNQCYTVGAAVKLLPELAEHFQEKPAADISALRQALADKEKAQ